MIHSASFLATGSDMVASTWVASSGLCWRISSMTFSSASVSAFEVDDVAATAAGATCLRSGRAGAARWRGGRAGAIGGAGVAAGAVSLATAVNTGAAAVVASGMGLLGVVLLAVTLLAVELGTRELGTRLRAIGRGFGRG